MHSQAQPTRAYLAQTLLLLLGMLGGGQLLADEETAQPITVTRWGHSFYYPASARTGVPRKIPLVVYVHGCQQAAFHSRETTRLQEWAERLGFAVLMPEQSRFRNWFKCWNWFVDDDVYEMNDIVKLVREYQAQYPIKKLQTYVMGLSAGGVMTSHLLACHSDLFSAGAVFSGAAYRMLGRPNSPLDLLLPRSPSSPAELSQRAYQCMKGGRTRRPVSVMVFHGNVDLIVLPRNGEQAALQFSGANHLVTGAGGDLERAYQPTEKRWVGGGPTRYSYTVTRYPEVDGARVELVTVHGMGHAWSGGPWWLPMSDTRGPDATAMALRFFGLMAAE